MTEFSRIILEFKPATHKIGLSLRSNSLLPLYYTYNHSIWNLFPKICLFSPHFTSSGCRWMSQLSIHRKGKVTPFSLELCFQGKNSWVLECHLWLYRWAFSIALDHAPSALGTTAYLRLIQPLRHEPFFLVFFISPNSSSHNLFVFCLPHLPRIQPSCSLLGN